ncbi:MAG: hypothetical protein AB2747_05215 [Candidatus Thiodiazotropha taylori]
MIKLGSFVKDRVTGLTGVAENRASFLYGCDRYFVQPQIDADGKVPKGLMVDAPQLEVLDQAPAMDPMPEPPQKVTLGNMVSDPIRGERGTATGRAVYLNGCSRIYVEPRKGVLKLGDTGGWWADEQQLKPIEKTISKPDNSTTGGPARSCSKY